MPNRDSDPPDDDETPSDDDDDAPADDDDEDNRPYDPVEGDDPTAPSLAPAVVHRFLTTTKALAIAKNVIRKLVPKTQVQELVTEALVSALTAPPPHLEAVLPGWFAMIARRRAADWLRKNKRRSKYEGPMPVHVAREDDYSGEAIDTGDAADVFHESEDDRKETTKLLGEELDDFIGDHRRDLEVRAMIRENSLGKTYAEIGAARGLTHAQVANRILRFKVKYSGRVKRQRQIVLWFRRAVGAGVAGIVAVVLYFLFVRPHTDDIRPDPSRFERPSPSASASAPVFLQALPPPPEPSAPPDTQEKPKPARP